MSIKADIALEKAFLEALMTAPERAAELCEDIDLGYFREQDNRIVFSEILSCLAESRDGLPKLSRIQHRLKNRELEELGLKYQSNPVAVSELEYNVDALRQLYLLRGAADLAWRVGNVPGHEVHKIPDIVDEFSNHIRGIDATSKLSSFEECMAAGYGRLEKIRSSDTRPGVGVEYSGIARYLPSFDPETLTVMAGDPGTGKTALMWDFCLSACKSGPVLVFSMEMSGSELGMRQLAKAMTIDHDRVRNAKILEEIEIANMQSYIASSKDIPLFIDFSRYRTAPQIAATARRFKKDKGSIAMVAIDYIGKVKHNKSIATEPEQIGDTVGIFKDMATILEVPVIALSQFNRDAKYRGNKRPMMSDLKGSQSIEATADVVMLLANECVKRANGQYEDQLLVDIAKHRAGRTGHAYLDFNQARMSFTHKEGIEPDYGKQQKQRR